MFEFQKTVKYKDNAILAKFPDKMDSMRGFLVLHSRACEFRQFVLKPEVRSHELWFFFEVSDNLNYNQIIE